MSDWTSPTLRAMEARQVIRDRIERASQPRRIHSGRRRYLWEL